MLSRRWIINYIILVLIAALIYAGLNVDKEPTGKTPAGISQLVVQDIDSLEIENGDIQLKLKRSDGAWMIEVPINWPAHGAAVERLLGIVDLDADALGDAIDVNLAPLGLQEPVATLRFNDSQLLLGANNNIGARRYAMIESKVYLLPDAHLPFITQGLAGIVDRHLLPRRFTLGSLRLPDLEIRRDTDNGWRSAHTPPIESARLAQLVENWQNLEASRVTPYLPVKAPRQVIGLQLMDGRNLEFVLLASDPEIVIAHPQIGLQYHFRSNYYNQLISPDSDEISG